MVPAAGDVSFFLKTVLADFAGDILFEFSNMVRPRTALLSRSRVDVCVAGRPTRVAHVHPDTARIARCFRALLLRPAKT